MRILITGSRTWTDADAIHKVLDEIARQAFAVGDTEIVVVHGCAFGADTMADLWVQRNRVNWPVRAERYPAQWKKYGRRAGFIRNHRMVRLGADVCLAFIRDGSPGATQCADLAEEHSIRTERFLVRTDASVYGGLATEKGGNPKNPADPCPTPRTVRREPGHPVADRHLPVLRAGSEGVTER